MGYYTYHTLHIVEGDDNETDYKEEIADLSGYNNSLFEDTCKWYDHDKDMIKYSKKHPNVVFEIMGEGEEAGDLWYTYYKNGKMQFCKAVITYDEYDESKLIINQ